MSRWGVRAMIPLASLGRLQMPRARIRYRDGWVRLGLDRTKRMLVATLEDRDGVALPSMSQAEAYAKSALMGRAIVYHLLRHNRYVPGEHPGHRGAILVGT